MTIVYQQTIYQSNILSINELGFAFPMWPLDPFEILVGNRTNEGVLKICVLVDDGSESFVLRRRTRANSGPFLQYTDC